MFLLKWLPRITPVVSAAVPSSPIVKMTMATSTSIKVKPCCDAGSPRRLFCIDLNMSGDLDVARRRDCDHTRPRGVCYCDLGLAVSGSPPMEIRRGITAGDGERTVGVI